ncbi:unnamed protein product, partial [Mesorhabditis belari]|uniref:Uncharacterized protein n=1 Tax=Mesorhabditis belari TaxID=2138241 RepID=A0AAF3F0X9_9BILA
MSTSIFFIAFLATPLFAGSLPPVSLPSVTLPTVTPKIPIPNVDGTCKCPLIPDLQVLDCILDFISHVNILTKTEETVNGTKFNKYTLQHLEILKGGLELPSVVLVPMGPCGLELEANVEYLLSGVLTETHSSHFSVLPGLDALGGLTGDLGGVGGLTGGLGGLTGGLGGLTGVVGGLTNGLGLGDLLGGL